MSAGDIRHFRAWLELPYYVGVTYESSFPALFRKDLIIDVTMRFRNDLLKLSTDNPVTGRQRRDSELQEYLANPKKQPDWFPRYARELDVESLDERVRDSGRPYLHVQPTETVIELAATFPAPAPVYSESERYTFAPELMPQPGFFGKEVLPHLALAIDAYRVATLPAVRFSIHPVSEALVGTAFIEIRDEDENVIQQFDYGFDVHGHMRAMQPHIESLNVQERFEQVLADPTNFEAETQLCSSYFLFHMRRWGEAVAVAAAVVDRLLRYSVFSRLDAEIAELLWMSYRTRGRDVVAKLLPGLGLPKLSDEDPDLWHAYTKAREFRGYSAHGGQSVAYDRAEEDRVINHLRALYGVARWLTIANGSEWGLDITEDGKPLRFF